MNAKNHGLACAVICGMAPMMGPAAQPPDQAAAHQTPASHVMTLDDAIRLATAHHPGLHAGAWRVEAAEGRAKQMRLWPNPELEFTAEEIPVPLHVDDAIAYIAQNPVRQSEFAIATFKRSIFLSTDSGSTWTQIASEGVVGK